jgi:hypothetical protein
MKTVFSTLLFTLFLISSCQDDTKLRVLEQEKENQKRELVFKNISKGWKFNTQPITASSQELTKNWSQWREFLSELGQQPKSTIGAFQQKAKTLSKKANDLYNTIPSNYSYPGIKSRIEAIATKINSINLYIHLNPIRDKKIIPLIQEINIELISFQNQLQEVDVKKQIKLEDGESDMLRMLDTTRAIPSSQPKTIN